MTIAGASFRNRFNGWQPEKPFKRFQSSPNITDTQLKQGVNEKYLAKPLVTFVIEATATDAQNFNESLG